MTRWRTHLLSSLLIAPLGCFPVWARADEPDSAGSSIAASASRASSFQLAVGGSFGFQNRNEYGTSSFTRVHPELVTYGYFGGFLGPVWLRPGLRIAYLAEQPEMPQSARVEERDWTFAGELGAVFDWYVLPSLTMGGGVIRRRIELVTKGAVSGGRDDISRTEVLSFLYGQLGVGIPLWKGFVVVEPFYRYSGVKGDARITSTYGLEFTFQVL
jgi:hypothetical protein